MPSTSRSPARAADPVSLPVKRRLEAPVRGLLRLVLLLAGLSLLVRPGAARQAAIASAHPLATAAGFETLAAGGNLFDAAVTVSAVLAVVQPESSGLGGGGFWLLRRADGRVSMIDGRERAPLAASADMYLDAAGRPIPRRSLDGPLAAGIPGEPAALALIARRYGRLPLARSLAPAIRLARDGFVVDEAYRRYAGFRRRAIAASPGAAAQFLDHGEVPAAGWRLRQPDLARTLERLAAEGRDGFYAGKTARLLVAGVRAAGGIWTGRDLAEYRAVERAPIRVDYAGLRVFSAAPPSSGGVALAEMLHMLDRFDLDALTAVQRKHLLIEVMRRAYRDRARFLGDPDQVAIPLKRLLDPAYANSLIRDLSFGAAGRSRPLPPDPSGKGLDTTHFSMADSEGNAVAATLSINYGFGSGFVPPGTGVLLNDEMDDFSMRPGVPNVYGLVGGRANAIAPGRRMLSSMSPTLVETPKGLGVLGTPGGSRIITMVLLGILDIAAGEGPDHWVRRRRFHHQYLPDEVQYEPGAFSAQELRGLRLLGHRLRPLDDTYGDMQAVWRAKGGHLEAASDPRGSGAAQVKTIRVSTSPSDGP